MHHASSTALSLLACAVAAATPTTALAKRRQDPPPSTRPDVVAACAHVASMRPGEVSRRTLRSGTFDIDGDGKPETVVGVPAPGTMGGDAFEILDAAGTSVEWEEVDVRHGSDILLGGPPDAVRGPRLPAWVRER